MNRADLQNASDREILIQLRIAVAVMEERTEGLPEFVQDTAARAGKLETDVKWVKRIVWSAIPAAPIIAGAATFLGKLILR